MGGFLLLVAFWLWMGFWCCWKRDWYAHHRSPHNDENQTLSIVLTILFSPIAMLANIFREFIFKDWI